jgi:hypothetical protein
MTRVVQVARTGEEIRTGIWCRNLKNSDDIEGPGMCGRIILKWLSEGMDCIHLAYGSDGWEALVKAVTKRRVP